MKISTLMLALALALGSGLSGNAMAHDDGDRGYRHGHGDRIHHAPHVLRHNRHARHWRGPWRRDHRAYRPYYEPRYSDYDGWYSLQLFLGGH